jgi:hypothetical protein
MPGEVILFAVLLFTKEPLIKSVVPVVQGGTTIFRLRKQLENVEKRKLDFLFSRSEKSRMDLFRASLTG